MQSQILALWKLYALSRILVNMHVGKYAENTFAQHYRECEESVLVQSIVAHEGLVR